MGGRQKNLYCPLGGKKVNFFTPSLISKKWRPQTYVFALCRILILLYFRWKYFSTGRMSSILFFTARYSELLKKTGFFKKQKVGFSAQIYRVTLTKTWFFSKGMLTIKHTIIKTSLAFSVHRAHAIVLVINTFESPGCLNKFLLLKDFTDWN